MRRQNLKKAMDTRLSGFYFTPEAREKVFRQMGGEKIMKKKMALGLVLAVVMALLMAGAAIAWGGNLFSVFSGNDASLQYVADHALTIEPKETLRIEDVEESPVTMDSAYFDGSSLYLSYRVTGGNPRIEAYAPTSAELQEMQLGNGIVALSEESPVMTAFLQNYQAGIAGGYFMRTIGRRDHITTTEGIDVLWVTDSFAARGEDQLCYIQFASPLPDALAKADTFTLQLRFSQIDLYVWFDGENLYSRSVLEKEYTVPVNIVRNNAGGQIYMTGQGSVLGVQVAVQATVSPVAITLTYPAMEGLEFSVIDPATGEEARCEGVDPQADGTVVQTFSRLGSIPEKLTACPIVLVNPDEKNQETVNIQYLKDQAILLEP